MVVNKLEHRSINEIFLCRTGEMRYLYNEFVSPYDHWTYPFVFLEV